MEELKKLYREATGLDVAGVEAIPGAGSNRKYYRLKGSDGSTLIGAVGTSRDENHAFCYLGKHFTEAGLPVPQVIAESKDGLRYLQSDLGNQSLFDALKGGREAGGRYNAHEKELLSRTIAALPAMQPQLLQVLLPQGYRFGFPRTEAGGIFPVDGPRHCEHPRWCLHVS